MGFRELRDLWRVPRLELTRRLGPAGMHTLAVLRGEAVESLALYQPPDRFARRIELDAPVDNWQPLLFPLRRLVNELARYLLVRDGGVQRFELRLEHEDRAATRVPVGLVSVQREAAALYEFCRGRLERAAIGAEVSAIALIADDLPPFRPGHRDLFEPARSEGLDWPALTERLRSRLGDDALQQLACVADHRPERAWRFVAPGTETREPARLTRDDGKPARAGRPRRTRRTDGTGPAQPASDSLFASPSPSTSPEPPSAPSQPPPPATAVPQRASAAVSATAQESAIVSQRDAADMIASATAAGAGPAVMSTDTASIARSATGSRVESMADARPLAAAPDADPAAEAPFSCIAAFRAAHAAGSSSSSVAARGDGRAVNTRQPTVALDAAPAANTSPATTTAPGLHPVPRAARPLWLLPQPIPLRQPLTQILSGPERIESGWWDGGDVRRDYYVVRCASGQRAWAFLPAGAAEGWMLHGWFA
nr:hypothetical protein [Tahibacter caeni]